LIADGHDVGRFDVRVREALAVEMTKCIEKRSEHFASFFCRECTFRENSPEVFLSVLHHHENQIHARKLTAPAGQQAEKIWMIKLRGAQQKRDLGIRLRATTHEFNGEIFRWLVAGLR